MEKNSKIIILIVAVIAVVVAAGAAFFIIQSSSASTVYLSNSTTIQVPTSNESTFVEDDFGVKYYKDPANDIKIISWNSDEDKSNGTVNISEHFNKQKGNDEPTVEKGVSIYYNNESGMYCIEVINETSHDNILIMCKDKNQALKMYFSIKYGVSGDGGLFAGDAKKPTKISDSDTSSSSSSSSDDSSFYYTPSSSSNKGGSNKGGSSNGGGSSYSYDDYDYDYDYDDDYWDDDWDDDWDYFDDDY